MRTDRPTAADRVRVAWFVLLVVGSGCATAERVVAPSPAVEVTTAPDPERPERWFGAIEDDEGQQTRWTIAEDGGQPEVVGTYSRAPIDPGTEGGGYVTDVAFDQERDVAFVGLCCEPVSGSVFGLDLADPDVFEPVEQGTQVDVLSGDEAFARSDSSGSVFIRSAVVRPERLLDGEARGASVALSSDGGTLHVAVLVDPRRLSQFELPPGEAAEPELIVYTSREGAWTPRTFALDEQPRFCGVAFVAPDRVGLLRLDDVSEPSSRCVGSQVDVYDLEQEELRAGVIEFAEPVQHVSADDASAYLIYTSVSGKVGWRSTSDGGSGELADGGFVGADW